MGGYGGWYFSIRKEIKTDVTDKMVQDFRPIALKIVNEEYQKSKAQLSKRDSKDVPAPGSAGKVPVGEAAAPGSAGKVPAGEAAAPGSAKAAAAKTQGRLAKAWSEFTKKNLDGKKDPFFQRVKKAMKTAFAKKEKAAGSAAKTAESAAKTAAEVTEKKAGLISRMMSSTIFKAAAVFVILPTIVYFLYELFKPAPMHREPAPANPTLQAFAA